MIAAPVSGTVTVPSSSPADTRSLARTLARVAQRGDRIDLQGELGAGKTEFAKGFAEGLGVREVVNSPSFTLIAEYAGRMPLFHVDLYRLAGSAEAIGAGMLDERQGSGVTLVEWPERLEQGRERERLLLRFTVLPSEQRRIEIDATGQRYARYVTAAREWRP